MISLHSAGDEREVLSKKGPASDEHFLNSIAEFGGGNASAIHGRWTVKQHTMRSPGVDAISRDERDTLE